MTSYEALNPSEPTAVWLSGDPDAVQYCFNIEDEAYYTDWLVALIDMAEGDNQIGNVGAGPIEASLLLLDEGRSSPNPNYPHGLVD